MNPAARPQDLVLKRPAAVLPATHRPLVLEGSAESIRRETCALASRGDLLTAGELRYTGQHRRTASGRMVPIMELRVTIRNRPVTPAPRSSKICLAVGAVAAGMSGLVLSVTWLLTSLAALPLTTLCLISLAALGGLTMAGRLRREARVTTTTTTSVRVR